MIIAVVGHTKNGTMHKRFEFKKNQLNFQYTAKIRDMWRSENALSRNSTVNACDDSWLFWPKIKEIEFVRLCLQQNVNLLRDEFGERLI